MGRSERRTGAPSFAQLLRKHRLAAGFSQEKLAELARMSTGAIGALERGERRAPYRATIELIAAALKLSASDRAELETAADRARGRQSVDSTQASINNLPVKLSSFIDRETQVAEIKALLQEHRLVTLTGSGGVGKTRVAVRVARQLLSEGWDDVRFVDLAPVRDNSFVAGTIASVVGIPFAQIQGSLPALPATLRHRSLLLLLDNCEHVIDGAAAAASAILQGCPGITILATSRERLAIDGEHVYRLPSLDGPQALRLLSERATASDARFVLSADKMRTGAEICGRLGGIPLAIELAATRVPALGLETLNARLKEHVVIAGGRDLPERQRTTLATIAWSYRLLSATEQALFRRLAIFRTGATLEEADSVCSSDVLADENIAELMSRLVDKSLVEVQTSAAAPRFTMLDSIHAFAFEQLTLSSEWTEIGRAHARHVADVCERAGNRFGKDFRDHFLLQFAPLLDDARAALEWVLGSGDDEDAILGGRIAGYYRGVWLYTNRRAELRGWVEAMLPRVDEERYPNVVAAMYLALIQSTEGAAMRAAIHRAVKLFERIGFRYGMILVYMQTAWQARVNDNIPEADEAIARAFAIAEETKQTMLYIYLLDVRATIHIAAGRTREARLDLEERARAMVTYYGLTDKRENAHKEAMLALIEGNPRQAAELLENAVEYNIEQSRSPLEPLIDLASVRLQLGDSVAAEAAARQGLELVRLEGSDLACWALQQMAVIAASHRQPIVAAQLFGFVNSKRAQPGREDAAFATASRKHLIASLAEQLSPEAIDTYSTEGAALGLDEAIELAESIWRGDSGS